MSLSPRRGFFCCRTTTGGYHPRLWSVVSSRLLASRHELLFVRKTDRKGPRRKRENFPRTAIIFLSGQENKPLDLRNKMFRALLTNYFQGLKIYFQSLIIYFQGLVIYFQALKIILSHAKKTFIQEEIEFYYCPLKVFILVCTLDNIGT